VVMVVQGVTFTIGIKIMFNAYIVVAAEVVPAGQQGDRARELALEIAEMRKRTAGAKDFAKGIASFQEKRPAKFEGR